MKPSKDLARGPRLRGADGQPTGADRHLAALGRLKDRTAERRAAARPLAASSRAALARAIGLQKRASRVPKPG